MATQYEMEQMTKIERIRLKPTFFHKDTPAKLKEVLTDLYIRGDRVRLFYGDTATGRDWLEESDVLGRLGRSTGIKPVMLLIEGNKIGGPQLLDHCILKVMTAQGVLWQASNYQVPNLTYHESQVSSDARPHLVLNNGQSHAAFTKYEKAIAWMNYMSGLTMTKPKE